MTRPISIQDIARAAGVSHTTVSRALHDNPLISGEVRVQIQQLADRMGYTPNGVAQSLKGQRTQTIGLVVTSISDPFVGRVVRGIEEEALQSGLNVFLGVSYNDPERELAVIESFHRRRVDGVIIAASLISAQHAERLAHINIPTVLINQQSEAPYPLFHTVSSDDLSGACLAIRHLIDLGHRRIAYLGAGNRPRSNRLRLEGCRAGLAAAGIPLADELVRIAPSEHHYYTDDVADGQALSQDLIAAGATALFCYNDMLAVGALLACRAAGRSVPDEISIVGYDDIELAQYVTPALTTIHQPRLRLGQQALQMLRSLLQNAPVEDVRLPVELVRRASTAIPSNIR